MASLYASNSSFSHSHSLNWTIDLLGAHPPIPNLLPIPHPLLTAHFLFQSLNDWPHGFSRKQAARAIFLEYSLHSLAVCESARKWTGPLSFLGRRCYHELNEMDLKCKLREIAAVEMRVAAVTTSSVANSESPQNDLPNYLHRRAISHFPSLLLSTLKLSLITLITKLYWAAQVGRLLTNIVPVFWVQLNEPLKRKIKIAHLHKIQQLFIVQKNA